MTTGHARRFRPLAWARRACAAVLVLPWDSAVVAALAFGVGFVGGVILGLLA